MRHNRLPTAVGSYSATRADNAARALDYLLLSPDEKINYRAERNISLKTLYETFRAKNLERSSYGIAEAAQILGMHKDKIKKMVKAGELEVSDFKGGKKLISAAQITDLLERQARLVPIPEFYKLIEDGMFYIHEKLFDKTFGKYYELSFNKKVRYVSIASAAKILSELRKRKDIIENWPTREEVLNDTRIDITLTRLRKLMEEGELKSVLVGYSKEGTPNKNYRICPLSLERFVSEERKRIEHFESGVTTNQMAEELGVTRHEIGRKIRVANELGLFSSEKVSADGKIRYLLAPEIASLLIGRRLVIPSSGLKTIRIKRRNERVLENERLVYYFTRGYRSHPDYNDIVQCAFIGLMNAVETHDPKKGALSTHAGWQILGEIDKYYQQNGRAIKLPQHILQRKRKFEKAKAKAEIVLFSEEEIRELEMLPSTVSTELFEGDDGENYFDDTHGATQFSPEETSIGLEALGIMQSAFSQLSEREERVIRRHVMDGEKLVDLRLEFGVTPTRIGQIRDQALAKLNQPEIRAKLEQLL